MSRNSGSPALLPKSPGPPIFQDSRVCPLHSAPRSPRSSFPQSLRSPGSAPRVPVQCAPCPSAVGRLAGLDAGLHQLHVRLHVLDTRVVELTRGLRQLREAASDTRDAVQALQEAQSRADREHGRLEGEFTPRRAGKEGLSGWGGGGAVGGRGPERSRDPRC